MSFVAADVGGTKTLLALARPEGPGWIFEHRARLPSAEYSSLEGLLDHWLQAHGLAETPLDGIGLAVAGPVSGSGTAARAQTTNLQWPPLAADALTRRFGAPAVLLNDFAAVGASLDALQPTDVAELQRADPEPEGLRLVVGAGTGLGSCLVCPAPRSHVFAGEGGHADFSPANSWQAGLAEWVRARLGRCSREHLLSGSGIARITAFLHERAPRPTLARILAAADPAVAVSDLASSGNHHALEVIRRFVEIYAGQLGDLALAALPRGGMYVAGGIAPRWRAHFESPDFLQAFRDKPPMCDLLARLPLYLITHPEPGLLGAARAAQRAVATQGDNA